MFAATLFSFLILHFLIDFGQNEVIKAYHAKNKIQKEYELILSSLEEAIITKDSDENSISYANKKGTNILTHLCYT